MQTTTQIRETYAALADHANSQWIPLSDLRDALIDIDRSEMDEALKALARGDRAVHLIAWDNQQALTGEQRAAALRFGGAEVHAIGIDRH